MKRIKINSPLYVEEQPIKLRTLIDSKNKYYLTVLPNHNIYGIITFLNRELRELKNEL